MHINWSTSVIKTEDDDENDDKKCILVSLQWLSADKKTERLFEVWKTF